ncbi:hypothetical protein [Bizionia echini]|nr:hypothetical protein [Bizionia echini]
MKPTTPIPTEPCNKENIKIIVDGINDYNLNQVSAISDIWTRLEFVPKDESGIKFSEILWSIYATFYL